MPAIDPAFDTGGMATDDEKKKKDPSRTVNPVQDQPMQQDRNYVSVVREGGYTPSPLSPYITPNPVSRTPESIVQRFYDLQFYAPNLADKPGMATAIALDPHVSKEEIRNIAALELAASRRLHLESLDKQMQIDVWQNLSPVQQRALLAIGFVPGAVGEEPVMQQEDGGFWGWLKPVATFWTPAPLEDDVLGAMDQAGDVIGGIGDGLSWAGDKIGQGSDWVEGTPVVQGISDSVVGDVIGGAGGLLKANAKRMVDAGMFALSEPQELVFQDLRAFRLLQGDDLSFSSLSDIQEAFAIAEDGNRSYDEDYLAEARARINNDELYNLAYEVNSIDPEKRGEWYADKVAAAEKAGGTEAAIDLSTKLQSSDFADAMGMVDAAHISVGRMIAQDYGLANMNDSDFDLISGSLDFTARITLDPWLLAGGASKAWLSSRYALKFAKGAEDAGAFAGRTHEIMKLKPVRRYWEGTNGDNGALALLNTIRESDDPVKVADATRRLQRYGGIDDTMNQAILKADKSAWKFRNADDVERFVLSEHGKAAVFTGKAAFRLTKLQKKNMLEHAIAQVKPGKVTDWLDLKAGVALDKVGATRGELGLTDDMVEGGAKVTNVIEDADQVGAAAKATGSVMNQAWQKKFWYRANVMLTRLTTKVPVPKEGKLWLNDADAVKNVHNMARTFGTRQWADTMAANFAVANEVGRRQIYKGMMETLGEAGGITRTAEGRRVWSEIVSRSLDENYGSLTGADDIGNGQKAALYAHQLRPYVNMPDFSLLHAQAQRIGVLGKMGGHFTREGYDWFVQRAFKPSVLLRPALVLRNAGEEVLRHVVDNGAKSYIEGRMVRTHLRSGYARKGGLRDPALEDEWRFFRLFTKPAWAAYEKTVDTLARKPGLARGTRRNVRDWFAGGVTADMRRAFLVKSVGREVVETLEELWDTSPRFRRIYTRDIMENSRAAWTGLDSAPKATAGLASGRLGRAAAGRAGRVQFRETGGYSHKSVEGHEGAARWTLRLDKLANDEFGMVAMEHLDDEETALRLLREILANDPDAQRSLMGARKGVDEWARRIYEDVKFHFVGENGRFQQELFDRLVPVGDDGLRRIDYEAFDIDAVDELVPNVDDRPLHVLGQDVVRIERNTPGLISRIVDGGFDYIGEATNYISRGPLFFANMIDSVKDTRVLAKAWEEAGIPADVVAAGRKAYARKMHGGTEGFPTTFHTYGGKYEDIPMDTTSDEFGVGAKFYEDSSDAVLEDENLRLLREELQTPSASGLQFDDYRDLGDGFELLSIKHVGDNSHGIRIVNEDNVTVAVRDFYPDPHNPDRVVGSITATDPSYRKGTGRIDGPSLNHRMYQYLDERFREVHIDTPMTDAGKGSWDKFLAPRTVRRYKDVDEAGRPIEVVETTSGTKWSRLNQGFINSDSVSRSVADEVVNVRRFDDVDDVLPMLERARELSAGRQAGRTKSVWLKGKVHDLDEPMDAAKFERGVRSFAKHAGLDDSFVQGQLFRATRDGDYRLSEVYRTARGAVDDTAANEALAGAMRTLRIKAFRVTDSEGRKVARVLDRDMIVPDKFPSVSAKESKWAKQQMLKVAEQKAVERTLKFVDNPIYRSQFSVIARNLFPFWRAQEEFYRRWANTFKHSPESFRKAQLMMMGFEHSGFVQKDDQGNSYFVYPYLGEATEAFRKFGEKIGIDLGAIPQVTQYSGQIRFLNQGIDPANLQPAVSPLLGFPVGLLTNLYPEMQPLENLVVGEQGANRNIYTALLPTPIRRLIEAGAFSQDDNYWTEQMLSAAQNSVAALEAAGLTPPDDASADEIDAYLERVRNYTKFTLTMRAVWGALAPTPLDQLDKSPELPEHLQFDGVRTFDQQFMTLVESMGYEKAITFWAEQNPDMVPFTESKTQSVSGAYWKSTEKTLAYYNDNKELFDDYPRAATFLFPLDEAGEWSPDAFSVEMANSLRGRKDMLSFYKDMKLNGKITEWYNSKANVDQAIADAVANNDYVTAQRYQESYNEWTERFLASNPLFKEYQVQGASRALERENLIGDMKEMLPHAPQSEATEVIGDMIASYENYKKALTQYAGSTSYAEMQRKVLTASYNKYMEKTAKTNDNAWLFYNRTFRYMEN